MGRKSEQKIIKPRILHRAHVTKDLEKIFSTPLFFVISSMGFGKTTAVRDFLNKKRTVKNSLPRLPLSSSPSPSVEMI